MNLFENAFEIVHVVIILAIFRCLSYLLLLLACSLLGRLFLLDCFRRCFLGPRFLGHSLINDTVDYLVVYIVGLGKNLCIAPVIQE